MQTLTPAGFADALRANFAADGVRRSISLGPDRKVTYNVTDLTEQERGLARNALAEWSVITGITFVETTGGARITYINDRAGATTSTAISGTTLLDSTVNVSSSRLGAGDGYGSYVFRTYMHETAHALGLGHPQDYASGSDFSRSTIVNDSWQMSVMSYFSQAENTAIDASHAYNITPMIADYLAVRAAYGAVPVRVGNTTYGVGSTAGGALDQIARLDARMCFLLADTGGIDTLSFAGDANAMRIDLRPGAISDVRGLTGNMQVAADTVIENVTGGRAADHITGNAAANRIAGGSGRDTLAGGPGNDTYVTEGGDVIIEAVNAGQDTVLSSADHVLGANIEALVLSGAAFLGGGNALANRITGTAAANRLNGGGGADTLVGLGGDDVYLIDALDVVVEGAAGGFDTVMTAASHRLAENVEGAILTGAAAANLTGNALDNTLKGNAAQNIITGGLGADRLVGLGGDDAYVVDSRDTVVEVAGGGIDTVLSAGSVVLAPWIERGILSLDANANLVGNELDNLLRGNAGANRIEGRAGDDILESKGGADTLIGGLGNDAYVLAGGATIIERADQGLDSVYSEWSRNLPDNVERLFLTGARDVTGGGNLDHNTLVGNAGDNLLDGGRGGNDTLTGGAGADRFLFRTGRDVITDFVDALDTVLIAGPANGISSVAEAMAAVQQVGGDVLFDFGTNELLVRNTTLAQLQGDVMLG